MAHVVDVRSSGGAYAILGSALILPANNPLSSDPGPTGAIWYNPVSGNIEANLGDIGTVSLGGASAGVSSGSILSGAPGEVGIRFLSDLDTGIGYDTDGLAIYRDGSPIAVFGQEVRVSNGLDLSDAPFLRLPVTATDGAPQQGMLRFSPLSLTIEVYDGTAWGQVVGGSGGGGGPISIGSNGTAVPDVETLNFVGEAISVTNGVASINLGPSLPVVQSTVSTAVQSIVLTGDAIGGVQMVNGVPTINVQVVGTTDVTESNTGTFTGSFIGDLTGNVTGNVSGTSGTTNALANPITIAVSGVINGSALTTLSSDVTIPVSLTPGSINTASIADGAVGSVKLSDNAVTTVKIADGSVTTLKIASGAVTSGKISAGAVDATKLAAAAVIAEKIADDAVITAKILNANVTTAKIADAAITASKLAAGAVTTSVIADLNVTNAKIADLAVTTAKVADGTITAAKLGPTSVQTAALADLNVTEAKLAAGAVATAKIANGAVTAEKIATGGVGTGQLADNSVTSAKIVDGSVGTAELTDSSVTTAKIANAAVTTDKLASNAVGSLQIANSAVTTAKIALNAITSGLIADANVTAAKLGANAVTTSAVLDGAITSAKLAPNAVASSNLADGAVTAAKIATGSVSARHLALQDSSNILPDNGLEDFAGSWSIVTGGEATVSRVAGTTLAPITAKWAISIGGGTDANNNSILGAVTSTPFLVEAGKQYLVTWKATLATGLTGTHGVSIHWFDKTGAEISTQYVSSDLSQIGSAIATQNSMNAAAPATAATAVLRVQRGSSTAGGTATGTAYAWDLAIRVASDGVRVGTVSYFAMSTPPSGWLEANGATISRAAFPQLFAAIGTTFGAGDGSTTFQLPDLRGEFIRGLDNGRGVDVDRVFGSSQSDQNKAHSHTITDPGHTHTINAMRQATGAQIGGSSFGYGAATISSATTGITIDPDGGNEARPRNVALLVCIKAFDAATNQGTVDISALAQDVVALQTAVANTPKRGILIMEDRKAAGTSGGTFTAATNTRRTLNTVIVNTIPGASLASSVFTLPAGTYRISFSAPAYAVNYHRAWIWNITAGAYLRVGTSEYSNSGGAAPTRSSFFNWEFTIGTTSDFELVHRCDSGYVHGLGVATNLNSLTEIYSIVTVEQIA